MLALRWRIDIRVLGALFALSTTLALAGCSDDERAGPETRSAKLSSDLVLYDDALENGWGNGSWDTRLDFGAAISADFSAWGGILLAHDAIDTGPYSSLRFQVNGGSSGGKAIEAFVKLPGNANGTFVDVGSHCDGGSIPADRWVTCDIPLSALGADAKAITAVVFQEWTGASLSTTYFDQIVLVGSDGNTAAPPPSASPPPPTTPPPSGSGGAFRGDGKAMPSFGGWAWGNVPADAVARAGFEWFETGYPGDSTTNQILRDAGVRPFAYINLGEVTPELQGPSGYDGPVLRYNGDWGTYLVDVTNASWQDWLVRRADFAYDTGSRGVKWDVATPDIPPGKSRSDVDAAMASVMQRLLAEHPDFKFIYNGGFDFALAYPQYVHGVETEGLFSASSYPAAYLQPWLDPYYWGPQYQQAKRIHDMGVPIFVAEYFDPWSQQANELYDAISAQGFVPYITSVDWNIRGRGYNVAPGW